MIEKVLEKYSISEIAKPPRPRKGSLIGGANKFKVVSYYAKDNIVVVEKIDLKEYDRFELDRDKGYNYVSLDFLEKNKIDIKKLGDLKLKNCRNCLETRNCTNCDYCIGSVYCKDSSFMYYSEKMESCGNCRNSSECVKCIRCENCKNCTNCKDCNHCYDSYDLVDCEGCSNCEHCVDCKGLQGESFEQGLK